MVQRLPQTSQLVHYVDFQPATSTLYHNPHLRGNGFVGFTDPIKPRPTSRAVCGLDGGHPCVWITTHACQTFIIHPFHHQTCVAKKGWYEVLLWKVHDMVICLGVLLCWFQIHTSKKEHQQKIILCSIVNQWKGSLSILAFATSFLPSNVLTIYYRFHIILGWRKRLVLHPFLGVYSHVLTFVFPPKRIMVNLPLLQKSNSFLAIIIILHHHAIILHIIIGSSPIHIAITTCQLYNTLCMCTCVIGWCMIGIGTEYSFEAP